MAHILTRGGGGGTPYNGPYWEAPPERGTLFKLEVYKRVGISRVEVLKKAGKNCHLGNKGDFQNISNKRIQRLIHPSILRGFSSERV